MRNMSETWPAFRNRVINMFYVGVRPTFTELLAYDGWSHRLHSISTWDGISSKRWVHPLLRPNSQSLGYPHISTVIATDVGGRHIDKVNEEVQTWEEVVSGEKLCETAIETHRPTIVNDYIVVQNFEKYRRWEAMSSEVPSKAIYCCGLYAQFLPTLSLVFLVHIESFELEKLGDTPNLPTVCLFVHVTKIHDRSVMAVIESNKKKDTGMVQGCAW